MESKTLGAGSGGRTLMRRVATHRPDDFCEEGLGISTTLPEEPTLSDEAALPEERPLPRRFSFLFERQCMPPCEPADGDTAAADAFDFGVDTLGTDAALFFDARVLMSLSTRPREFEDAEEEEDGNFRFLCETDALVLCFELELELDVGFGPEPDEEKRVRDDDAAAA